jgi:Ca2+/Na+ antiporter
MNRILGIIGAVLIIIGLFCPIVSVFGINISYFDSIKTTSGPDGFIFLGLGVISLVLALLNKTRLLIATGVLTLGYVALSYFSYKSRMSEAMSGANSEINSQLGTLVQLQWGWAVLVLGGILLLVAGIMKKTGPLPVSTYGAPPPPPPPGYAPGPPPPPPYNR